MSYNSKNLEFTHLRAHGRRVGYARIAKLMRRAGIRDLAALSRRTRTTDSRHHYPIAPNLPRRNFTTTQPNRVWPADISDVATNEGWLYVSGVLDLCTRNLVGWPMNETLHAGGALEALRMAIDRQRPPPGLIHHSDRGIQYASEACHRALATANITPSMSRKGDCRDNAPMESFFHTLKTECVHDRADITRDEARGDLFGFIKGFFIPIE